MLVSSPESGMLVIGVSNRKWTYVVPVLRYTEYRCTTLGGSYSSLGGCHIFRMTKPKKYLKACLNPLHAKFFLGNENVHFI